MAPAVTTQAVITEMHLSSGSSFQDASETCADVADELQPEVEAEGRLRWCLQTANQGLLEPTH
ncbi:hypothetical protein MC885_014859 [Smutsia gigantea]|nr:hypothetical protein MC885_007663 [Smutsia gigantea]KAK2507478.1 hypothetical protein MC885_014859 [Smutsia gigantea]